MDELRQKKAVSPQDLALILFLFWHAPLGVCGAKWDWNAALAARMFSQGRHQADTAQLTVPINTN